MCCENLRLFWMCVHQNLRKNKVRDGVQEFDHFMSLIFVWWCFRTFLSLQCTLSIKSEFVCGVLIHCGIQIHCGILNHCGILIQGDILILCGILIRHGMLWFIVAYWFAVAYWVAALRFIVLNWSQWHTDSYWHSILFAGMLNHSGILNHSGVLIHSGTAYWFMSSFRFDFCFSLLTWILFASSGESRLRGCTSISPPPRKHPKTVSIFCTWWPEAKDFVNDLRVNFLIY